MNNKCRSHWPCDLRTRSAATQLPGSRIWIPLRARMCRFQRPRDLRRRSAAARLMIFWFRIPRGCMDVCCDCCMLSGRGLCDEPITHPEKSYRLWCVVVCDLETSRTRWPCTELGGSAIGERGTDRQTEGKDIVCCVCSAHYHELITLSKVSYQARVLPISLNSEAYVLVELQGLETLSTTFYPCKVGKVFHVHFGKYKFYFRVMIIWDFWLAE